MGLSRTVPFDENEICDKCGEAGAFDFMGDMLCAKCSSKQVAHACTECGKEEINPHSTSLCKDCQIVLLLSLREIDENGIPDEDFQEVKGR